jgi:CHAT domain-containing protein
MERKVIRRFSQRSATRAIAFAWACLLCTPQSSIAQSPAPAVSPASIDYAAFKTAAEAGRNDLHDAPDRALAEFQDAERIARAGGGERSDLIAAAIEYQAAALLELGRDADALDRERAAANMMAKLHGPADRGAAAARERIVRTDERLGLWRQAYDTCAAIAPVFDGYTAAADANLVAGYDLDCGTAATQTSRFDIAMRRLLEAYEKSVAAYGNPSIEVADVLEKAGSLESARGSYRTAITAYTSAEHVAEKAGAASSAEMAEIAIGLGKAEQAIGDFHDAEPPLRFALAYGTAHSPGIRREAAEELLSLLIDEGRISEGVETLVESMPDIAGTPAPRATPNPTRTRDPQDDIDHSKAVLARIGDDYGERTLAYAGQLANLEGLYERAKRYDDARATLATIDDTLGAITDPDHPMRADALRKRADLAADTGDLEAARAANVAAIAIYEKSLGSDVQRTIEARLALGDIFLKERRYDDARDAYVTAADASMRDFQTSASYASENDRVAYAQYTYGGFAFGELMKLCWQRCVADPVLAAHALDMTLALKGEIARNARELRIRMAAAGGDVLERFDAIRALRAKIAALRFTGDFGSTATQTTIGDLTAKANAEEGRLARDSAAYAATRSGKTPSWRDVAAHLEPGDAAVVVTQAPLEAKATGYYAFVIRRTGDPVAIPLVTADALEGVALADYRALVDADQSAPVQPQHDPRLYDAVWKPLEPALAGAKRVFFAPDGDLTQISLAVIPDDRGGYLFESRDIRVVSSLADLLYPHASPAAGAATATLLGNPNFDAGGEPVTVAAATRDLVRSVDLRDVDARPSPLPGTGREIASIDALLRARKWSVTQLEGNAATKAALERTDSPRVLHLATHGFFLEAPSAQVYGQAALDEDPMLRSGLLLAGATGALAHRDASASGILTAYEASNLKLANTQLVVLSACDSGLGFTGFGDGVFGLRRAFHEAGAAYVMMSMWSVPDRETQELMKSFYGYWLGGSEMHLALARAMRDERAKVIKRYGKDLPRLWGAFVIDG